MTYNKFAWSREPARDYRWRCGLRSSRWFKSRRAACNAAVRAKLGWWEGEVFISGPLVEIEYRRRDAQ